MVVHGNHFSKFIFSGAMALTLILMNDAAAQIPENPDLSQCDNCKNFPDDWLEVDESDLLDLESMRPERRLDFLIGEWEILFPYEDQENGLRYTTEDPVGFDIFTWRDGGKTVIDGFQEWPFTSGGKYPFRSRTDFRYVKDEGRWQMIWLPNVSTGIYTGGLEEDGVIALYEHEPTGGRKDLSLRLNMRYVFRNITNDTFIAEEWNSADGGATYPILKWRVLYRRRAQ